MKHLNLFVISMILSVACFAQAPAPITGPSSVCVGVAVPYSDVTTGGTWSCSSTAIAAIGATTGVLTGVSAGTVHITYTLPSSADTVLSVTVAPPPCPISGPSSVCLGAMVAETDCVSGGAWSCSAPVIATIGFASGMISGVAVGTTTLTYTTASGCVVTMAIAVRPAPVSFTVTGGGAMCAGGSGFSIGLSGSSTGVSYSLYLGTTLVGSAVAGTGSSLSFGSMLAAGVYTVAATTAAPGCTMTMGGSASVVVNPLPAVHTITGGGPYCAGGSGDHIILDGSDAGINYQLYDGGVPVGAPMAGIGAPLDFGWHTVAGVYTIVATNATTLCTNNMAGTAVVSVTALPVVYAVTGGGSYCAGGAGDPVGLANSTTGVTYQLYNGSSAVGSPVSGTGTAISFGTLTAAGTYTVVADGGVTGCATTMTGSATISVNPLPVVYNVTGGGSYCAGGPGSDVALSGSDAGIHYQLYLGGVVTGAAIAGTGMAFDFGMETGAGVYTAVATDATTGCTSSMAGSATVTVAPLPTVTATASSVACDGSYTLSAGGATSYTWTPGTGLSCVGCASPSVTPSATTSYTVMGTSAAGCTNTASVSVDGNRIMGSISPSVSGSIEVWLIQFNPADSSISALDSQVACTSGGSQYYNFADPASGNYMVKAYVTGGTPGASGYIPTYGTSSAHWYSATGITHSSATDNMNITMIYGTVPSGPGFISGFVASGAGRGTSVPAPSVGMLIYLTDASGNVLTYTKTDGSGNYSFGSLANGTYIIYPEDYQYNTTASSTITLSSLSESVTGIDFKQYTTSMIIIPFDYSNTGVSPVTAQQGISVFPNPAADKLNISWKNQTTGTANLVITDVLGRDVYKSAMNINATSGSAQVGLQGIKDGIYLLTIKGESINYSAKVLIEE